MAKAKNVEIECPKCGTNNVIPRPWELTCQKCNATLGSGKYSKRMMSAWAAFVVGIFGTLHVSDYFSADRYSMSDEYAIIEDCINVSKRPFAYPFIIKKRDICICALEKTQNDFDANAYRDNDKKGAFLNAFDDNANDCIREL